MKNSLFKISVIAISAILPFSTHAESAKVPLVSVGADESGAVLLQFPPGTFNDCGCLVALGSDPGAKQILATAMMAKTMNLPVFVNRITRSPGPWSISDYVSEIRVGSN